MPDYRSDRMQSPEGRGIARKAWDTWARSVNRAAKPATDRVVPAIAAPLGVDLVGFWLSWHLEGGFEGMRALGMSRSSIYRRTTAFRKATGLHPDEYEMPGVKLSVKEYIAGGRAIAGIIG